MTTLNQKAIQAARQWCADNATACIAEAQSGEVFVNDLPSYIDWQNKRAADALAGKFDSSFTLRQRAHFIQTGECVALLG